MFLNFTVRACATCTNVILHFELHYQQVVFFCTLKFFPSNSQFEDYFVYE